MMKILHILSQRPDSTGSGYYVQNVIRLAARAGHYNYLLAALPVDGEAHLEGLTGISTDFVRFNSGDLDFAIPGMSDVMPYESSIFSSLTEEQLAAYEKVFAEKIHRAVTTFKPDIIHSHHLWIATAVCRRVFPQMPLLTSCHSTALRQFEKCHHLRERVLTPCRSIDRVLSLSSHQAEKIMELYGIDNDRIDVVGSGYNDEIFCYRKKLPSSPVQILYAGKLSYSKGVDLLLQCCMQLDDVPIHLHLVGSGTGEEADKCLELAAQLRARITVHGKIPQLQLARLMGSCHIFVLPSFFEGLPLVLLEAVASGCRIIATDLPGCRELLEKVGPELVEFIRLPELEEIDRPFEKDIANLQAALGRAIRIMVERTLGQEMLCRDDSQRYINSFRWSAVFVRIEKAYRKVLSAKQVL